MNNSIINTAYYSSAYYSFAYKIQVSLARLGAGFGSATGRQLLLRIPAHPRVP